jgi:hypothetical protein
MDYNPPFFELRLKEWLTELNNCSKLLKAEINIMKKMSKNPLG